MLILKEMKKQIYKWDNIKCVIQVVSKYLPKYDVKNSNLVSQLSLNNNWNSKNLEVAIFKT